MSPIRKGPQRNACNNLGPAKILSMRAYRGSWVIFLGVYRELSPHQGYDKELTWQGSWRGSGELSRVIYLTTPVFWSAALQLLKECFGSVSVNFGFRSQFNHLRNIFLKDNIATLGFRIAPATLLRNLPSFWLCDSRAFRSHTIHRYICPPYLELGGQFKIRPHVAQHLFEMASLNRYSRIHRIHFTLFARVGHSLAFK